MTCRDDIIDRNKSLWYNGVDSFEGGYDMTPVEIIKDLIARSPMQQKDLAEKMGWVPQSFSNKVRRNTFTAEELLQIVDVLGYEIKIVEKETNDEVTTRRKRVGPRLKLMVNGVKYDTFKSDAICHSDESEDMYCELYRDCEGRYFVAQYVKWEGGVNSISPIGEEDAERLMEKLNRS